VLAVVEVLKRRRSGERLLAYRAGRDWSELTADEVNAYIAQHASGRFTAKDFRTWNATALAAVALAVRALHDGRGASRSRRDRKVAAAIKTVAAYLGNTPAVCRASYVDPRVIDRYHAGTTIAATVERVARRGDDAPDLSMPRVRRRVEEAVLDLLHDS
jgi:DNA topoisomerase IB